MDISKKKRLFLANDPKKDKSFMGEISTQQIPAIWSLWVIIGGFVYYLMRHGGGCCGGHDHDKQA